MKIQYKNVCSIRNAEVEFKPGSLICIRGETNQGKSAMFYALLAGLTNSPEYKKFINNKALEENPKATAWIGLYDDEGNLWQVDAGTGHMHYRANDAKYEKVGRKNIFDLIEGQIPGLLYDPDNTTSIMNIVDEDTGMFPIDRSDAQIFKTYERLLSLSCTEDILRTIKLDQEDIDYKCSDMTKSIQKHNEQISKMAEMLKDVDPDRVSTMFNTIQSLVSAYKRLSELYDRTKSTAEYTEKVNSVIIPELGDFDIQSFSLLLNALVKANNDIKYITLANTSFSKQEFDLQRALDINKAYDDANSLVQLINEFNKFIKQDEEELESIKSILDTIKTCPYCGKPIGECND